MFAGLMQDHKVVREKDICPKFLMEQISDFKLSTKLRKIYHHQMDIMEQETTGQSWPVLGIAILASHRK